MSFDKVLTKVFGSSNERFLKSIHPTIAQISAFEPEIQKLSDDELRARTQAFRERIAEAVKDASNKLERNRLEQDVLNEILPEAFAIVREGSKRTTGMRHFDVQMIGGIVMHQGKIAEMRTGEGKTSGRDAACLSQRADWPWRARDHRERLPRGARRRMDGPDLSLPRFDRRLHPERHG